MAGEEPLGPDREHVAGGDGHARRAVLRRQRGVRHPDSPLQTSAPLGVWEREQLYREAP